MAARAEELQGRPRLLTGWGRTAATVATTYQPRTFDDVERLFEGAERGVIARGLGRSYGDAAQNAGGRVLDMTAMTCIRHLDLRAGTVTVDAGVSLDALMRRLLPSGWFVAVSPGTRFVTVGGAIACDIHGKNHHRDGSFCDHVVDLELCTPSGDRLRADAATHSDVFWATAGGMGLTGVVLEATLRLLPVETTFMRVDIERASDLDDAMSRMENGDQRYRYSVAWIDCLARGANMGRSVLTRADHAVVEDLPPKKRARALEFVPRPWLVAPGWIPDGLLRRSTVAAFNEMWFRRAPQREQGRLQPLHAFFHPLDGVTSWNRLYGPAGFLQYQFVVPFGAEGALRQALQRLSETRAPSFLAVLKRFGRQRGMVSFPMPGWTLAVDLPTDPRLAPLLNELDEVVASAGGRVYMAKDSRLRPDLLEAMYPDLDQWRRIQERLDPAGLMRSDLARRLGLP